MDRRNIKRGIINNIPNITKRNVNSPEDTYALVLFALILFLNALIDIAIAGIVVAIIAITILNNCLFISKLSFL